MTKSRGIHRKHTVWTDADVELLRSLYPDMKTADIAARLGRELQVVYRKASVLGLKKSAAFMASEKSGRMERGKQDPRMIASRFQPGLTPWNKGSNYVAGGRSAETRFKPGRKPEENNNYRPIGSLRITEDGWLERKVTDDRSVYPARRWVALHRLVWEAAHGPIPKGHIIVFKPGMKTAVAEMVTADKLECITRAENAHRNSMWRKDPELARLYQLKGAISRQVNKISKEQRT